MRLSLYLILFTCVFLLKSCSHISEKDFIVLNFNWDSIPNQSWLGYNFWCNSFSDWKVENHKAIAYPFFKKRRTAHITSHKIAKDNGSLTISAKIKLFGKVKDDSSAVFGFLIGAGDSSLENRTNNFVFNTLSPGECHLLGIKSSGDIILKDYKEDTILHLFKFDEKVKKILLNQLYKEGLNFEFKYLPEKKCIHFLIRGNNLVSQETFTFPKTLSCPKGNIALFYDSKTPFTANASFDDIKISGSAISKIKTNSIVSPILSSFYTNTIDSLFITVQLMPFNPNGGVKLKITGKESITYEGVFDSTNYQLRFRVELPSKFKKIQYKLYYTGPQSQYKNIRKGVILSKPINSNPKLMALNCNGFTFFHSGGIDYKNLFYPYRKIEEGYKEHQPDVLAFLGDQIYESRPEMAIYKEPFCNLDYLYKWSIWCYSFRALTLNQPTIIMTDDHDVFQGNIWGNGGVAAQTSTTDSIPSYYGKWNYDTWQQDNGGYFMSQNFVNMVTRSQTSHLPYPENPKLENGMINYYTSYQYGNLNFAILEDKKFKSPPSQNDFKIYNGFSLNPTTTASEYHKNEFKLLGESQLKFLSNWSKAEKAKKESRVILTQSAYASLTTVQIDYTALNDRPAKRDSTRQKVSPDMDTNGWPKIGRDRALEALNDSNVLFISGDQHMGAVIDVFDSNNTSYTFFSVPAIANTWPRMWWPKRESTNPNYPLGNYLDAFGNKMNIQAIANPNPLAPYPNSINCKSPGFGIIQFDEKGKTAKLNAFPLYFNSYPETTQFEGWPVQIFLN